MPNYYMVKSGGTATGDGGRYTSQQSGSFANALTNNWGTKGHSTNAEYYYGSVQEACAATTIPAHGDFICESNASAVSTATAMTFVVVTGWRGKGVICVCVDDSNCENTAVATTPLEYITGGVSDWGWGGGNKARVVGSYGFYVKSDDDISGIQGDGDVCRHVKTTHEVTGTSDLIQTATSDGTVCYYVDCDIILPSGAQLSMPRGGSNAIFHGGSVTGAGAATLFDTGGNDGGGDVSMYGVDLSATTTYLWSQNIGEVTDRQTLKIVRCKLNSGVAYMDMGQPWQWKNRIEVYNSGHDSKVEWQYYVQQEMCDAEAISTTRRNQSVAWPVTGDKTCIAVDVATSGYTTPMWPFIIDLPSRYAALSSSGTDEITVYLSGESGITDKQVWVELIYPDGTSPWIANRITSSSTPFDPFATGTALTPDGTSTWTSGGTNNYKITISTASDPGTNCVPIIRLHVQGLSSVLYVDWLMDLS